MVLGGAQDLMIKYRQVFSTLQFLLSPSRQQLLTGPQVFQMFILLHLAFVMMIYGVSWALVSTNKKAKEVSVK
jgi:hypothetical protein